MDDENQRKLLMSMSANAIMKTIMFVLVGSFLVDEQMLLVHLVAYLGVILFCSTATFLALMFDMTIVEFRQALHIYRQKPRILSDLGVTLMVAFEVCVCVLAHYTTGTFLVGAAAVSVAQLTYMGRE